MGDGDDVVGRAGRAGARRPGTTSPRRDASWPEREAGRMAGGVQRDHAARDHRARGGARALLARPGAAARAHPGPPAAALEAFVEGWAHYAEELCVEQGFGGDDPRFEIGVWLEALLRVTRLACAIGVHTAGMTRRGGRPPVRGRHAPGRPGRARRGPAGHVRPDLRPLHLGQADDPATCASRPGSSGARASACSGSTRALLALGSPPLGLLGTAIVRG